MLKRSPAFFLALSVSLLLAETSIVHASETDANAGTRDFSFIEIMTPARTMALAEANVAVAEGIDAIGSNPAGLTKMEGERALAGTFRFLTLGSTGGQVTYVFGPASGRFALSAAYLNSGEIETVDEEGNSLGAKVQPSAFSPSLSYAKTLSERWRLGLTLKGFQEYLGDIEGAQSAIGVAGDIGIIYLPGVRNLGFGLALLNAGRKFVSHTSNGDSSGMTPMALRGGFYFIPAGWKRLRLTGQMQVDDADNPIFSGAGEWTLSPYFIARAGLRGSWLELRHVGAMIADDKVAPFYGGEARRLGLGFTFLRQPIAVDYGVQWWTRLGFVHALTLRRGW